MSTNKIVHLLPDMVAFVTVVEEGSFTAASKKLRVTPSRISRQIANLEDSLSVSLLERTTRKQSLTSAGKEALIHCQAIVDNAKEMVNISESTQREINGKLRVSIPKAYGRKVLSPLLLQFMQQYPNIELNVKATDRLLDPIHDDVDIVFRLTRSASEHLVSKQIGSVDLYLCTTSEYLQNAGTPQTPDDLYHHSCLHLGETLHDNEWEFEQDKQKTKVSVAGRYSVNNTGMRLDAVFANLGIGIFPDFIVQELVANKQLVRVLPDWTIKSNYQGKIIMQYTQTKHMPAKMRTFIDFVQQHISQ